MKNVYRVLYLNETPFINTNIETAEMIKYANNAFLALKISFINEVANLCESVGASVHMLRPRSARMAGLDPSSFTPVPVTAAAASLKIRRPWHYRARAWFADAARRGDNSSE